MGKGATTLASRRLVVRISALAIRAIPQKMRSSLSDPRLRGRTLFRFEHVVDCEASVCYNGQMFFVRRGK